MSLPQTNLQLYQCLIERDTPGADLERIRAGYDTARALFGDCFRPNHKPFTCHLIGTAGALAIWRQPTPVVIAGLLHSVYLFGRFGDGDRGPTARRRRWLNERVGAEAEDLIWRYTKASWKRSAETLQKLAAEDDRFRDLLTVKFADTLDELIDGGPRYSVHKPLPFGLEDDQTGHTSLLRTVTSVVSKEAAEQFRETLQRNQRLAVPPGLKTSDRSFHAVNIGIDQLRRGKLRQRIYKWSRRFRKAS